ncbi:hypothetical protein [Nibricoccus sp. IMCC34717]|uniref:hypothetical protein n=1 Tax=Nibricoccus sp. IMCC34717 TaxID=3034021 RepID=UPI0038516757
MPCFGTELPPQPDPPDYAAANREGIYTDIETLPIRRMADQAARLGKKIEYADPRTGEWTVADFSGLGDIEYAKAAARLALDTNEQMQRGQLELRQSRYFDPKAYAAKYPDLKEYYQSHKFEAPDFDTFLRNHWENFGQYERETGSPDITLGEANAQQTAREIRAADPLAYDTRQELTGKLLGELQGPEEQIDANAGVLDAASAIRSQRADPRLGTLYDEARSLYGTDVNDSSTDALNFGLKQALADYQLGGKLDDATKREITDSVRAGQASRGNFLGDAAATVEAMEMGSAAEQRKQQRLGQLLDVQGRAFGQNTQLRGDRLNALNSRFGMLQGLQGNDFNQRQAILGNALNASQTAAGEERAARQETYGRKQQKFANASAFVLGMPVTNQFGSLGAAQQGSVGFTPITGAPTATLNANAGAQGAQWAQGNYNTAANMWNTAANVAAQDNASKMGLIGGIAGAGIGAML